MSFPTPTILGEAIRIWNCGNTRKRNGWKRHGKDWKSICEKIVKGCWNGSYFQTSTGHFQQFYSRDFGWCIESLLKLGYREQCRKTLAFALKRYAAHGRITSCITPSGTPFDFPDVYSPDSVAYFFRSLAILNDQKLIAAYQRFLQQEIDRFAIIVIDPTTGMARKGVHFSGMKDHAIRNSSCYESIMIDVMGRAVKQLQIFNYPFQDKNFEEKLVKTYWTGRYFKEDLDCDFISGDANVFPFTLGVVRDRGKLKHALDSLHLAGLDQPFPLRYEPEGVRTRQEWFERFVPNWERTAHWAHLGIYYIVLLAKVDRKEQTKALDHYKNLIERHGTLFECYTPDGQPYFSRFYHADEGMLWASILLGMEKNT